MDAKNCKKTTLVQSPFTTLGQETRWTYSTMLRSPHGADRQTDRQTDMERWLCGAVCLSGQLCGLPVLTAECVESFQSRKILEDEQPKPRGSALCAINRTVEWIRPDPYARWVAVTQLLRHVTSVGHIKTVTKGYCGHPVRCPPRNNLYE